MAKKLLFFCILLCLLAAAAGPRVVSAGVDPLASPTPQATARITAPVISGVNPDAVLSEGNLVDSLPSGSLVPPGIAVPVFSDSPFFVELESQANIRAESDLKLSRNVENIDCGPTALAQALKIIDPDGGERPPAASQLSNFMSVRGLMYDWGTGVEELAFTAREFGFDGSFPFHTWSMDQLIDHLPGGIPVVVSLGINGVNKPGHFVTLTKISTDGKWITFQDPDAGEIILSREEFQSLWKLQGNSGMIVQKKTAVNYSDPMLPWMGLLGAISAMALALNKSKGWRESRAFALLRKQLASPRRKGIGAGPLPPKEPEMIQIPRYETKTVYRGIKTVEVEVPVYETRKIKVGLRGIKKKVPQYETRRMQVGTESVTKRVPVYTTKRVKIGTRLVKKEIPITRYKTKKVMVWKKYTRRVPVYRNIGPKKIIVGYKNETRWKKVPVTKQIPYQTTKTISIQVPEYKSVKVISGYKDVTETVPKFEQKQILVGHKTVQETFPVFEERQVQVGTKTVIREMPLYETVKVPILVNPNPSGVNEDGDNQLEKSTPPTGISAEMWNSFSEEDQMKIELNQAMKGGDAKEKWWHNVARLWMKGIAEPIRSLMEHPEGFLKNIDVEMLPKFLSLSAKSSWDINIFSQDGMVLSTKTPPGLWQIFYMTQKFDVEQKTIVTINPGSLVNYYFTSGTGSIKITKNLSYIFGPSEWGISLKKEPSSKVFDYSLSKHMLDLSSNGISYKWKEEDVFITNKLTDDDYQVKLVTTRECETKTIKSEGLIVAFLAITLVCLGALGILPTIIDPDLFNSLAGAGSH